MAPAPRSALCSANFNQDFSCIAIGTRTGYSIVQCEPFTRVFAQGTLRAPHSRSRRTHRAGGDAVQHEPRDRRAAAGRLGARQQRPAPQCHQHQAAVDDLRAVVPDPGAPCAHEPSPPRRGAPGRAVRVRHQQHEAPAHRGDRAECYRAVCALAQLGPMLHGVRRALGRHDRRRRQLRYWHRQLRYRHRHRGPL